MTGNGNGYSSLTVAGALLAGVLGGTGVPLLAPQAVRPDPFTGADAERLHAEVMLELRKLEHRIAISMPPAPTRKRIQALEETARAIGHTPPTSAWAGELPPW